MPQGLVALLPLLFSGAAAGASIGSTIYSDLNQPGMPKTPAAAPTGPTTQQAQAAITPQALTIESLTGGSVSPDYLASIAPVLGGVGGQPNTNAAVQAMLKQLFGSGGGAPGAAPGGGGGTPSFQPSGLPTNLSGLAATPGVSDFLAKIAGGGS